MDDKKPFYSSDVLLPNLLLALANIVGKYYGAYYNKRPCQTSCYQDARWLLGREKKNVPGSGMKCGYQKWLVSRPCWVLKPAVYMLSTKPPNAVFFTANTWQSFLVVLGANLVFCKSKSCEVFHTTK
jgi:hypothetical protein